MKWLVCSYRRTIHLVLAVLLLVSLGSCQSIDRATKAIQDAKTAIENESGNWRILLPKLVDDLGGIESHMAGDEEAIVAGAMSQAQDLATQSFRMSDAVAASAINHAGAEFRCDANFVKKGVTDQLQYMIDDLKFWQDNRKHLDKKPVHVVCAIDPSALSLYPSGSGWLIQAADTPNEHIVEVYGYDFRPDALPSLEIQNSARQKKRDVTLSAAYVTQFQVNLDFSTETFAGVTPGDVVVLRWSDQPEPNAINLVLLPPATLKITDPVFNPREPIVEQDAVSLQVTITNQGDTRSGPFVVFWQPDLSDKQLLSASQLPLEAKQSRQVFLPPYVYRREGGIGSVVYLDNGDAELRPSLTIRGKPVPLPLVNLPSGLTVGLSHTAYYRSAFTGPAHLAAFNVGDATRWGNYDKGEGPGGGFYWWTVGDKSGAEPASWKLPPGVVLGLRHTLQEGLGATVFGKNAVVDGDFADFAKVFGGDCCRVDPPFGFHWYVSKGVGFEWPRDAAWADRLPRGTVVGLKQGQNNPFYAFNWDGRVYDALNKNGPEPPGYKRICVADNGAGADTMCWFEKQYGAAAVLQGHSTVGVLGGDTLEWNYDRPGGDYTNILLDGDDPIVCQALCYSDRRCLAWTFVHPSATQRKAVCWLKGGLPVPTPNKPCCVSGVTVGWP